MSGYCPVGKCECEYYDGKFCHAILGFGYMLFESIEVCPWPSRQVPVPDTGGLAEVSVLKDSADYYFNAGFRAAVQRCREEVRDAMAEWSSVWPIADAAISKVEGEIK